MSQGEPGLCAARKLGYRGPVTPLKGPLRSTLAPLFALGLAALGPVGADAATPSFATPLAGGAHAGPAEIAATFAPPEADAGENESATANGGADESPPAESTSDAELESEAEVDTDAPETDESQSAADPSEGATAGDAGAASDDEIPEPAADAAEPPPEWAPAEREYVTPEPETSVPNPAYEEVEPRRPFDRPTIVPRLAIGAGFSSFANVISIGVGATAVFKYGLGVGLDFDDTIIIYRDRAKEDFPGIEKETPTNVAALTPYVQWIILPGRGFSPYVRAGVGPVFYNNKLGTVGQWVTGAGFLFRLAGNLYADLGVSVSAQFPDARYRDILSYMDQPPLCGITERPCSLSVAPRLGLAIAFGVGSARR